MRLAELVHRKRKLEEAERTSEERLAAASKEATAKVSRSAPQVSTRVLSLHDTVTFRHGNIRGGSLSYGQTP